MFRLMTRDLRDTAPQIGGKNLNVIFMIFMIDLYLSKNLFANSFGTGIQCKICVKIFIKNLCLPCTIGVVKNKSNANNTAGRYHL